MKNIKYNACDLSKLIESTYGVPFDIVCEIMLDQKLIEIFGVSVLKEEEDQKWVNEQILKFKLGQEERTEEILEAIMSDLCTKNLLEAGDYLLEFND